MTIEAINGLKLSNSVSFNGKRNRKEQNTVSQPTINQTAKAVPVIVLMAMNPSLLNADLPKTEYNPNVIEIAAPETVQNLEKTYMISTKEIEQTQTKTDYVEPEDIEYQRRFRTEGKNWTMYYINHAKRTRPNYAMTIYLVPDDYTRVVRQSDGYELSAPPQVEKFVYHKTGDEREFQGAVVYETKKEADGHLYLIKREIRLPDDIANDINSMLSEETNIKPNRRMVKNYTIKSTLDLEPVEKQRIANY